MTSFLIGAKKGSWPVVANLCLSTPAAIAKDWNAVKAEVDASKDEKTQKMMQNKVKKCSQCSKPNGFTLSDCNGCGFSLLETPISFTPNIFTSFLFGIQSGPFPFSISVRHETDDCLIFDDLLALSPLHFNAIPAKDHIPDWRYLLRRPKEGLELLLSLFAACRSVAKSQFLSNPDFCAKHFRDGVFDDSKDFLCGFNYPPSQYQLHIQFMAPILLPYQRYLYERGVHFTPGRFFSIDYVMKCLEIAAAKELPPSLLQEDTPIADIISYFDGTHQHVYNGNETIERAGVLLQKYACWKKEDFLYEAKAIDDGKKFILTPNDATDVTTETCDSAKIQQMVAEDKALLQNYGKCDTASDKMSLCYYKYAHKLGELNVW